MTMLTNKIVISYLNFHRNNDNKISQQQNVSDLIRPKGSYERIEAHIDINSTPLKRKSRKRKLEYKDGKNNAMINII